MTLLRVINRDDILVVDHRLIAIELGIQPKNVLANIDKYLTVPESEEAFGRGPINLCKSGQPSNNDYSSAPKDFPKQGCPDLLLFVLGVAFETETLETNGGIQNIRVAYLNQPQAEFLMTLSRNTPQVVAAKRNLIHAFDKAKRVIKGAIPAHLAEMERIKLELHLLQVKQRYLDTSYAIQLSTSPAMLAWLRGETPPPPKVKYFERFIDARTGKEVGNASGRSLTQLIADAGLNPKSARDRNRVKRVLKSYGMDYDKMERWSTASYLRKYPVLEEEVYDRALKAVLGEVVAGESEQNLFVHQMQQATLNPHPKTHSLQGLEP